MMQPDDRSVLRRAGVTFKKVSSVREAMYKTMQFSRACYKLLNATGAIGCEGACVLPHVLWAWRASREPKACMPRQAAAGL